MTSYGHHCAGVVFYTGAMEGQMDKETQVTSRNLESILNKYRKQSGRVKA